MLFYLANVWINKKYCESERVATSKYIPPPGPTPVRPFDILTYDPETSKLLHSLVDGLKRLAGLRANFSHQLSRLLSERPGPHKFLPSEPSTFPAPPELVTSAALDKVDDVINSTVQNGDGVERSNDARYTSLGDLNRTVDRARTFYRGVESNLECPIRVSLELLMRSNASRLKTLSERASLKRGNLANLSVDSSTRPSPGPDRDFNSQNSHRDTPQLPPLIREDLVTLTSKLARKMEFLRERRQSFVQELCRYVYPIDPKPIKGVASIVNNNMVATNMILGIAGAHLPNLLTTFHNSASGSYNQHPSYGATYEREVNGALLYACQFLTALTDYYEMSLPFPIDLNLCPPRIREILADPNKEILLLREKRDSFPLAVKSRGDNINAFVGVSLLNRDIVYVCQRFSIAIPDPNRTLFNLKTLVTRILDDATCFTPDTVPTARFGRTNQLSLSSATKSPQYHAACPGTYHEKILVEESSHNGGNLVWDHRNGYRDLIDLNSPVFERMPCFFENLKNHRASDISNSPEQESLSNAPSVCINASTAKGSCSGDNGNIPNGYCDNMAAHESFQEYQSATL